MIKYERFINEAKINEFDVGTTCLFEDCYFNDGYIHIYNSEAVVTKIEKSVENKSSKITFVFYKSVNGIPKIILSSRQLRKVKIIGKNYDLVDKILNNKLSQIVVLPRLKKIFNQIGFNYNSCLSDKSKFDVDTTNPKNITYINSEDLNKENSENYRKSAPFEDIIVDLSGYKSPQMEYYVKKFISESDYNIKKDSGEYVKILISDDLKNALSRAGIYIIRPYYNITNIEIDWNNEKNVTYVTVENPTIIESDSMEKIIGEINNKTIEKHQIEKYREEAKYYIDKKNGKLAPMVISKRLSNILKRVGIPHNPNRYYEFTNFDLDENNIGNIICVKSTDYLEGKNIKTSITPKEFMEILRVKTSSFGALERECIKLIRLERGEIAKFESSKTFLQIIQKLNFGVFDLRNKFFEVSRFDIDPTNPENITCIPSIKISTEKNPEEFRISLPSIKILKILYESKSKMDYEKLENEFRKFSTIEIKLRKGEIAYFKSSEAFNFVLKSMKFTIKELYNDCSNFDLVKDNIDMISFIPSKKIGLENQEKFRQQTRAGRVFKKLNPTLTEVQVENFVNLYRAEVESFYTPVDIGVVTGNDIVYWYSEKRYATGSGTLNHSCMRGEGAQNKVSFYSKFPDKIALAIITKKDKLYGRSLIWRGDDGRIYMDRIYTVNSHDENVFMKFASQKNYITRNSLMNNKDKRIKVTLESDVNVDLGQMPYLDSMSVRKYNWVDEEGKIVSSSNPKKYKFVIEMQSNFGLI